MIFIHTLRMIVDLSFYFFFAEFVAAAFHGRSMLFEMLLLCLCYGILVSVQKFSKKRIFLLIPVLILFLPGSVGLTLANRIALIPPVLYILYLILRETYGLSWDRQADIFSASWKAFSIGGICICLAGKHQLFIEYSVSMALICLASSVLLLRMLRHAPRVYLDRQYQRKNCLLLAGVLTAAWLSSRPFVLKAIGNACSFFYMQCILPIFSFFLTCFIAILRVLGKLFSWIELGDITLEGNEVDQNEGINPFADLEQNVSGGGTIIESFFTLLIVILLILAVVSFFRWLAANSEKEQLKFQEIDMIRNTEKNCIKLRGKAFSYQAQAKILPKGDVKYFRLQICWKKCERFT